ncbi:MAG: aminoacyl--tRNA ligase-related protein, partial [Patescibacteria group bacterium]
MRQSHLATKTRKEAPADEVANNAKLLIRAGFIDKLGAGVYTYLPLGLRVLKNIENVIRRAMNAAGGQEILMPSLQPKENWEKTGRWNTMDDLYKVKDSSGRENALGPTHEEVVVPLATQLVSSYKDLPLYLYQIQNKFRMELRAKSGLLRGREFMMKDLYSFHATEEDLEAYYEKMKGVYHNIFEAVGLGGMTRLTFASGGSFSKYSHEFQTVTPAGEDTIYLCESCRVAVNKEIIAEQNVCPECGNKELKEERSIEVGNIFNLKTKFSDAFGLTYKDNAGAEQKVLMGCYGIGLSRVMGAVAEVLSDERGLLWPQSIAPFSVHLLSLGKDAEAEVLYEALRAKGIEVLYDDRDVSAGEKFADSDLIGIPLRMVVSKKSLEAGGIEVKKRLEKEAEILTKEELFNRLLK